MDLETSSAGCVMEILSLKCTILHLYLHFVFVVQTLFNMNTKMSQLVKYCPLNIFMNIDNNTAENSRKLIDSF